MKWHRLAADQGHAGAQSSLGFSYSQGEGVPQDVVEAMRWYRLAADKGDAAAQSSLGSMYLNGEGVPQDYVEAHLWFNLAAAQPSELFHDSYRTMRDGVAEQMTPEQLAEAQRRAREWTPKP